MFVIPCKYSSKCNSILTLVQDIRKYHKTEKIVVVDSASDDKSYFLELEKYNVDIQDVSNRNWAIGAYWHVYFKYPNEDFYFMIHDTMRVKANLDYLKEKDLTTIATFNRSINPSFNMWNDKINTETKYKVSQHGNGVYGPMFLCKNKVMKRLYDCNVNVLLPTCKAEMGYMEGGFGAIFEADGYNMTHCSLFGDIIQHESPGGKSYPYPFNTNWQYPIEKFYGHIIDENRK